MRPGQEHAEAHGLPGKAPVPNEEWRARAYAVRYVMSFSASALSVPLVAWISLTYGELAPLFTVLAALAAVTFAAALAFPGETRTSPVPAAS